MVILIAGVSHTGKTALAQRLVKQYGYFCLSIDHLKMGLIRSGYTTLTPLSDDRELTGYLWPVVREMIKTAIENSRDLIVEGCYIPFDWQQDFPAEYRARIRYICLVMSEDISAAITGRSNNTPAWRSSGWTIQTAHWKPCCGTTPRRGRPAAGTGWSPS